MTRHRVLIEDWLPIEELGIESRREREVASALPPLNFLHVWWARRPLVASSGVVLASLLPIWSKDLAEAFQDRPELETDASYKNWVLRCCGILGNARGGAQRVEQAKAAGGKRPPDRLLYGYDRAYTNRPNVRDLLLLRQVLVHHWGAPPSMLDPTAGGGSIPYVASRYGIASVGNDLNSVSASVLRGGVQLPSQWGRDLLPDLQEWGSVLTERIGKRLAPYFQLNNPHERVVGYLFARSVTCPRTKKLVPLAPNWWLSRKAKNEAAVVLNLSEDSVVPDFRVVFGDEAKAAHADVGTIAGGGALSPWDGLTIESEYIKAEAQAGRMGSILFAVAVRHRPGGTKKWVKTFRSPTETDLESVRSSEAALRACKSRWLAEGVLPSEGIPEGNKTREPLNHGMTQWTDLFSSRQLLVHGTFVEEFQRLIPEIRNAMPEDQASAVLGLLGLMQGKALDWNAILCTWIPQTAQLGHVFQRHDFAFVWQFGEFDGARELYPWCLDQLLDAYSGICNLLLPANPSERTATELTGGIPAPCSVTQGTAGNLSAVPDASLELVCIDPPYYDNVMYGELSDFFGVWEQHTVGVVWPDLMPGGLADVKNEAVANVARFADSGRKKRALAVADYEAKMQAIFAECDRVLRDDGVLTVMFTHKRAEAWDTLGMALMQAGFVIETSWPVNSERTQSLHQADKNSAASTIMLVCRKRETSDEAPPYFEDLESEVRRAAKDAVGRFSAAGISGVDLLLSTYGRALSVISAHWPVYSSEADESGKSRLLRPEEALDAAREEVVRMQRLALIGRQVDLDPITDFVLLAWSTFRAVSFPFDEARKMAVAVGGLDVSELEADKILTTRSGTVTLCDPGERLRRRGDDKPGVRPAAEAFTGPVIDALHTVLYVAEQDGLADTKALIDRTGLAGDNRFTACLQGLVRAIPRTKDKGRWVRPEAGLLDGLVTAYFPDIEVPEEWTGRLDLGV